MAGGEAVPPPVDDGHDELVDGVVDLGGDVPEHVGHLLDAVVGLVHAGDAILEELDT